eukprot:COSAG03_NODE_27131_length_255_cov_0.647436_1_plen_43_part_01
MLSSCAVVSVRLSLPFGCIEQYSLLVAAVESVQLQNIACTMRL